MKIAIIEPVGGHGGMEFYDFGMCSALHNNGWEVYLFTCDKTSLEQDTHIEFELHKPFINIYGSKNILLRGINFLKGLVRTYMFLYKKQIQWIQLHVFSFSIEEFLSLCLGVIFKRKIIVFIHDPISFNKSSSKAISFIYSKILHYFNIDLVTHSKFSRKIILAKICNKCNVYVLPHSDNDFVYDREVSQAYACEKLSLPLDSPIILFFGQIKPNKGLDVLLFAFKEVLVSFPNALLLVAGRFWKENSQRYYDLIENLQIRDKVIFRQQFIENSEVPLLFHSANVVVLPYRVIYSSGVLLRALGYGTPVIASALPAFREILKNGKNGLLFESENIQALKEAIIKILNDDNYADYLTSNGKKTISERNSWSIFTASLKEIIKNKEQEKR